MSDARCVRSSVPALHRLSEANACMNAKLNTTSLWHERSRSLQFPHPGLHRRTLCRCRLGTDIRLHQPLQRTLLRGSPLAIRRMSIARSPQPVRSFGRQLGESAAEKRKQVLQRFADLDSARTARNWRCSRRSIWASLSRDSLKRRHPRLARAASAGMPRRWKGL